MTPAGPRRPSPDLTIGLPVFNGERHLVQALDSILGQSYTEFSLVISDNASTDATEDICREYAATDERVSYVRQRENMGGAWNFNTLAERTSSPYFKWISHDDVTGNGFIERCMNEMKSAPEDVALCFPQTVFIDDNGEETEFFEDRLDLRQSTPHARLREYLDHYRMSNAIFGILRTNLLLKTRLEGSYASSDRILLAELAIAGQFWQIPERLFLRRIHEGMSHKANPNPEDIANWVDPIHPSPVSMTRTKLFVEYSRSIASPRLGLSNMERVRCMRELLASGGAHELRVIGGEMRREAKLGVARKRRRLSSS